MICLGKSSTYKLMCRFFFQPKKSPTICNARNFPFRFLSSPRLGGGGRGGHILMAVVHGFAIQDDDGDDEKDVAAATSLSTCITQRLAKASSLNLLAEDRARRRIERVSSSERERAWRSWVEYEEMEFAWNPVNKGDGGEEDLLVGSMVRGTWGEE